MKWSGLAPAVDAHLSRWSIIRRIVDMTKVGVEGRTERDRDREARRIIQRVADTDAGSRWLVFARSYGLPDEQGIPRAPHELIERNAEGSFGLTVDGTTVSGRERFTDSGGSLASGMLLMQREAVMLDAAVTHYVSAEVIDEVNEFAEASFPEPLFETDLLTHAGFAVLEKPLQVVDLHIDTGVPDPRVHVQVRAIGWHRHENIASPADGTVGPGVTLFLYTTPDDYLNGYVKEAAAAYGNEPEHAREDDVDGPFLPIEVIPWRFGVEWTPRPDDITHYIPGTVPSPVAFQRRWFFAFTRLMWQEIVVRHTDREPRQTQRRWDRIAERKPVLDYSTLRLRRVVDPDYVPSGMGIPLEHRVLVRAHPRRQWIPSLGPARLPDGTMDPATHRLIWIEQHWRGPEDGPLGPFHKATSVVR